MKKVLITMGVLAMALATAPASNACGAGGCSLAPMQSYSSSYNFAYGNGYNSNYSFQNNGSCCGAAAPIYSYYVPLAKKCCQQRPCGCAAPINNCGCGCAAPINNCGCGCKCQRSGYTFW